MEEMIKVHERDDSLDYLIVLRAVSRISFALGRRLLISFLRGNYVHKSVKLNRLDMVEGFGELSMVSDIKLQEIIENLISNGMLEVNGTEVNRFMKLLKLSSKGIKEMENPSLYGKKLKNNFVFRETVISDADREVFRELDVFLKGYNDEQKKAIISGSENILCVAGAGSGKTTALTKRIEFLVKYKGVDASKILAITFTRKARQEMINRLNKLGIDDVKVDTFNSFCEGILKKYGQLIYGRNVSIMNYGHKVMALNGALQSLGLKMEEAIDRYFSVAQKRMKTREQLNSVFLNDCFSIIEYFKLKNLDFYDFSWEVDSKDKLSAKLIYDICKYLKEYMFRAGLRDYSDQVLDALKFLKDNLDFVPEFEHVLVDEYQDVNAMQIELIDVLNGKNLFCVGDPRQSIFGWRGSDINYILNFEEKYSGCEVISLVRNYRSFRKIIDFVNESIRVMEMPDLDGHLVEEGFVSILEFDSEIEEMDFVVDNVLKSDVSREEIFVLARTNRQLESLSRLFKQKKIRHVVKSDEIHRSVVGGSGEVTLATIHAIKGLEARVVFVIGCNEQNFPCKASDHPVIEMVKVEDYDKEEEEKRLLYVALSRAKERLYLSYGRGKLSKFVSDEMKKVADR